MNTQTHILMGAAIFGRPAPRLAWAAAAGGLMPDLPMLAIVAGARMLGYSFSEIFGQLYWENWWQITNALGHSFLIWGGLTLVCLMMLMRQKRSGRLLPSGEIGKLPVVFVLSASALLHSVIDFLCHREDAHMHFWPLSQWRFRSPVSYWDPNYYGNWFGLLEAAIGIASVVVLFRRYRSMKLRAVLLVALVLYVAVPFFFVMNLGPHDQHGLPNTANAAILEVQD